MCFESKRKPSNSVAEDALSLQLRALDALAGELVGVVGVDVPQNRVKQAMLLEALTRTKGNLTRAAALLGVRRQAVQQMIDRYDLGDWTSAVRGAARLPTNVSELKAS